MGAKCTEYSKSWKFYCSVMQGLEVNFIVTALKYIQNSMFEGEECHMLQIVLHFVLTDWRLMLFTAVV
jgi:hypothetical protein